MSYTDGPVARPEQASASPTTHDGSISAAFVR